MNILAIDIGNTNINVALYLKDEENTVESIAGGDKKKLIKVIKDNWGKIPILKRSKEGKRDGVIIASSVKTEWTKRIKSIVKDQLDEKVKIMGEDIPYPMDLQVKDSDKVGSDRILAACAAFAVTENALVIADFGTAVTIDIVDERGIFLGGSILPGFEMAARALSEKTAQLPYIEVKRPELPFGKSTEEAINCGLYFSAIGALEEIVRRYAEKLGYWPQTIITGTGGEMIKDDCPFVDSYVPNLITKGIAFAYKKYLESLEE